MFLPDPEDQIIPRTDLNKFWGSLYSSGYMSNLDSAGIGPPRFRIGRKICYKRSDLIKWLEARLKKLKEK